MKIRSIFLIFLQQYLQPKVDISHIIYGNYMLPPLQWF